MENGQPPPDSHRPIDATPKVLLFRSGGVGDGLMVMPVPRYLRQQVGCQVFVASEVCDLPLWSGNPHINGNPLVMPVHLDVTLARQWATLF